MKPVRAKRTSPPGVNATAELELAADMMLPEQWARPASVVPEFAKRLAVALIDDARKLVEGELDKWKDSAREVEAARLWLTSPAEEVFSFRWSCFVLGWDADAPEWEKLANGRGKQRTREPLASSGRWQ